MIVSLIDAGGSETIRLGTSREQLREQLGEAREFQRGFDTRVADQFLRGGVMATYDEDGRVVLLEFSDEVDVQLQGRSLFGLSAGELGDHLESVGIPSSADPEDEAVVLAPSWQMSFYLPDGRVEGVTLGE